MRSDLSTARDLSEEMMRLAERYQKAELLVPAHRAVGVTKSYMGEFREALPHFEEGVALSDREGTGSQSVLQTQDESLVCRVHAAHMAWFLGYPERAVRGIERARA